MSVSVLMPAHNAAATIEAAVTSIAAQTYDAIHLVLVDDGSTDATVAVATAAWFRGGRPAAQLRILACGRRGLVPALNAGLTACVGTFVARMDADDIALPERLQLQTAALYRRPDVAAVGSRVENFGAVGEGIAHYVAWQNELLTHTAMLQARFIESPLAHPSVMLRRDVLQALGGYRDLVWAEDYDLWLRLAETPWRLAKLPQVLLRWRDHGARATRRDRRYAPDGFLRCKAHFLRRGPLRQGLATIWGAGAVGRRLARYLEAEGVRILAFFDVDPRKIGGVRRGNIPVLAPDALAAWRHVPCLACVGNRGARPLIRAALQNAGFVEGESFWCVA